jgi:hypothetical protein
MKAYGKADFKLHTFLTSIEDKRRSEIRVSAVSFSCNELTLTIE